MKHTNLVYGVICVVIAFWGAQPSPRRHTSRQTASRETQVKKPRARVAKQPTTDSRQAGSMRTPIDWRKPSETKPYPNLAKVKNLWVKVSLKKNRTYLYDGSKVIYTMYSTGGMYTKDPQTGEMKSMTPTGTYHVEAERGNSFYNQSLNEGANYYVSWLDHGVYLFHSVPTQADGSYNLKEAAKLGKSTGSHGCIRLSVPDAQWMSKNLPVGTKVEVVD